MPAQVDPAAVLLASDPHDRLLGVHPALVAAVEQILVAMAVLDCPMIVTAGVRTLQEQADLYAQGRTLPGEIVTNDDGVVHRSNHQVHTDHLGYAVDCAFLVNGEPSWDPHLPWTLYGQIAQRVGLHWGGTWQSLKDLPHVELPS